MEQPIRRKNITLKDIAHETGFSVTAVSHALKDMSDISEHAKEQIRACASRLGYIANSSASSLRTGKSKTIAVILGDLANPHFSFLAKEIERDLYKNGYSVFFISTNESPKAERDAIMMACSRNIDGIILCPAQKPMRTDNVDFILNTGIPCVLIGRHFADLPVSHVVLDDRKSGYLLGRHILERGHTRILYIDTPLYNSSSAERRAGFLSAFEQCSLPTDIREIDFDDFGDYFELSFPEGKTDSVTAIVGFNDIIAWDAMCRLKNIGKSVPEDICVAGFDNLHDYMPLPFNLTSIGALRHAMPQKAVKILLEHINNPDLPPTRETLNVFLFDRGSVRDIHNR